MIDDTTVRPLEETFRTLIQIKVATVRNGKYVYAPEFEETVHGIQRKRIGYIKQLKYGRKAGKCASNTLLKHAAFFKKSRRNINNLITSYLCLLAHLDRLGLKMEDIEDLGYAVWYLNDHEPEERVD